MSWKYLGIVIVCVVIFLVGCTENKQPKTGYRQIDMQEAITMMEKENGYIILDVRTKEEFAEKHIPGAINIPNEIIGTEPPAELPDKEQLILVYCRSGNRSKQAAQKLVALGYTNIVEFGGINSWPGETVSDASEDSSAIDSYMAGLQEQSDAIKYFLEHDAMTQTDMNLKSQELYELWDEALNYLWGELKNTLPEQDFTTLLEKQRTWIGQKEAAVKEAGKEFEGGSVYALIVNSEAARITEERVYELYEMLR